MSPGAASAAHPDTAGPHSTPPRRPTVSLHGRDPRRRHTSLLENSGQGVLFPSSPCCSPSASAGMQARVGPAEPSGSPGDHWSPCRQEGREWVWDQAMRKTLRAPGLLSECPGHCIHHRTWGSQACTNTSLPPVPPTPAMMPETLHDPVLCWHHLCWKLTPVRTRDCLARPGARARTLLARARTQGPGL